VQRKLGTGKTIKNTAAYLVCAIEDDYSSNTQPLSSDPDSSIENTSQQAEIKRPATPKKPQQILKKEWEKFRKARAQEAFQTLSSTQQAQHREAFLASGHFSGSCRTAFNNHGGWGNPLVEHAFTEHYLIRKLLTAREETSLEAFCEWKQNAV
jgi:hypothetical protein